MLGSVGFASTAKKGRYFFRPREAKEETGESSSGGVLVKVDLVTCDAKPRRQLKID